MRSKPARFVSALLLATALLGLPVVTATSASGATPTASATATASKPPAPVSTGKTPSAPINSYWDLSNPYEATPVWSPPAKTGGKPVTQYVLTLHTLYGLHSVETYIWQLSDVGVLHFGCLGNGYPAGDTPIWYFTVAAQNANGVGPAATSPYFYGNRCDGL